MGSKDERKAKEKGLNQSVTNVKAKNQFYTEQERRLLDQITIEIQEAWSKDILAMRQHYERIIELCKEMDNLGEKLGNLSENHYLSHIPHLFNSIEKLLESHSTKSEIDHLYDKLMIEINKLNNEIKTIKLPWYKRIFLG